MAYVQTIVAQLRKVAFPRGKKKSGHPPPSMAPRPSSCGVRAKRSTRASARKMTKEKTAYQVSVCRNHQRKKEELRASVSVYVKTPNMQTFSAPSWYPSQQNTTDSREEKERGQGSPDAERSCVPPIREQRRLKVYIQPSN